MFQAFNSQLISRGAWQAAAQDNQQCHVESSRIRLMSKKNKGCNDRKQESKFESEEWTNIYVLKEAQNFFPRITNKAGATGHHITRWKQVF